MGKKMSYEEKWKVLADLLMELQKKGEKIPTDIMNDLRSAKTIIHILNADPTHFENVSRIDTYLRNVESHIILTAEKLGIEDMEEWLKKIKYPKPVKKPQDEQEKPSRFISGIPREVNWVRIKILENTPLEKVKKLVKSNGLSYKKHKKDYIIVYGTKNNMKSFMRMMTKQFHSSSNR